MKRGNETESSYINVHKGQIWIETVVYTLIAMTLIGAVLAFVIPRIQEIQDKAIIEQSITVIEDINTIFLSVAQGGAGNKRIVDLGIKKGDFNIDAINNKIIFEIETEHEYSEIGVDVSIGNAVVKTEKAGSLNKVTLTRDYNQYDLTYAGGDAIKTISKATTPYKLSIENKGEFNNKIVIDMDVQ